MNSEINWDNFLPDLLELRQELHQHPELSEQEILTRRRLMKFLNERCQVEIHDQGRWFYVYQKGNPGKQTIAIRADHDAIIGEDGLAFHGCGHDGHSTILAGLVWMMSQKTVAPNIVYVFQHAEENGVGAKEIVDTLVELDVEHIYGLHNFPSLPLKSIQTKVGTIMCASRGMNIQFEGAQSHAAHPEKGDNPVYAIAKITQMVEELSHFNGYQPTQWQGLAFTDMVLVTIVSCQVGEADNFGVSPANGQLQLTLRASKLEDLDFLVEYLEDSIAQIAKRQHLKVAINYTDAFPDTSNPPEEVERLKEILKNEDKVLTDLSEPFRPSEDFGWYLKKIPGCFIAVGSGENHPALHRREFDFPDEIIPTGIELFKTIIESF